MKYKTLVLSSLSLLTLSSLASAQEAAIDAEASGEVLLDEAPVEESQEAEPAPQPAPAPAESSESTEAAAPAEEAQGGSDHESVVGHFGVGYMGRQTMTVGAARTAVVAPIIGARYWVNRGLGIDVGLGMNFSGGQQKTTGTPADPPPAKKAGLSVFFLHAGVPLSLVDKGHFSFQVVPEMNLGFGGTGDYDGDGNDATSLTDSGFHLSAGARAGGEIHFGFMGIPQLSLQGSIGLYLQSESGTTKATDATGASVKQSDSSTTFGTNLGPDPWDIFAGSISALYYF